MLLPQKEFALLLLFAQNENRILAAEYIYEKIWGRPMNDDAGAVRYHVSRLRKKLPESGYTIASEYGGGYRFEKA
jgi:DNA-binding response OmpR family regulator